MAELSVDTIPPDPAAIPMRGGTPQSPAMQGASDGPPPPEPISTSKVLSLPLPYRGVERYSERSAQPTDTTPNALNIMPFDRYGRRRLAQRGGVQRLFTDLGPYAVGSATATTVTPSTSIVGSVFGRIRFTSGAQNGNAFVITRHDTASNIIYTATSMSPAPSAADTFNIERTLDSTFESTHPPRLLKQAILAPQPDTVSADTLLFDESFGVYPNGTDFKDLGGVENAKWEQHVVTTATLRPTRIGAVSTATDGDTIAGGVDVLVPLIVAHTSATSASGTASAENAYGGYEPWRAVNGLYATSTAPGWSWASLSVGNGVPLWWQYQFSAAQRVLRYDISSRFASPGLEQTVSTWTFEGSNNGSTWTTLDTRSGITWTGNQTRQFTVASPGTYSYYRVNSTANAGGTGDSRAIAEIQMYDFTGNGTGLMHAGATDYAYIYKPTFTPGTNYRLDFVGQFGATPTDGICLFFRVDTAAPDSTGSVILAVFQDGSGNRVLQLLEINPAHTIETLVTGGEFSYSGDPFINTTRAISVTVAGNVFTVLVDGTPLFTATTNNYSNKYGVGISATGSNRPLYASIKAYSGAVVTGTQSDSLIAVSGRSIHVGTLRGGMPIAAGGYDVLTGASGRPEAAVFGGSVYFVNGASSIKVLDGPSRSVIPYSVTAGTPPARPTLAASWRGRLVLAGSLDDPQNFYMTRLGDPGDWDYSQTDVGAAVAGNAGNRGRISDPITSLIPFNNDTLVIGTGRAMYIVRGDPTDGGSIDVLTEQSGILQARSWAIDSSGGLWFVGASGLMRISPTPGATPEPLSSVRYPQFFRSISATTHYIDLQWDTGRHGLWVYVTSIASGASTHLFYDARGQGLWPVSYPDGLGPVSCLAHLSQVGADRVMVLGGRNSRLYEITDTATYDDLSTAISSSLDIGPFQLAPPSGVATVSRVELDGGEVFTGDSASLWNLDADLRGGPTAYSVTDGTPAASRSFSYTTDGRAMRRIFRVRGDWHALRLSNSTAGDYFSLERATLTFNPSGEARQ